MTDMRGKHKAALTHKGPAQCSSTAPKAAQLASVPEQSSRRTANLYSHTLNSPAAPTEQLGNAQVSQLAHCRTDRMAVYIQGTSDFLTGNQALRGNVKC